MSLKPDICTSFICNNIGCDYCKECNHAIFEGKTKIKGRLYEWEFNPRFGPLFFCKTLGKKDWCPNDNHEVWKRFYKWFDKHFKDKTKE